jgi:hypothetical protein
MNKDAENMEMSNVWQGNRVVHSFLLENGYLKRIVSHILELNCVSYKYQGFTRSNIKNKTIDSLGIYISADADKTNVTPDDGIICRNLYIESVICFIWAT